MAPEAGGCRRCTVGVPVAIAQDENGTTRHCFNCGSQWTEPATAEQQRDELTSISPAISQADLRSLARAKGLDPDKFRTPEALIDALEAKADEPARETTPTPEPALEPETAPGGWQ